MPRTHWDILLERRLIEELVELLKERLDIIKARRTSRQLVVIACLRAYRLRGW